jgi:hypothetical protein
MFSSLNTDHLNGDAVGTHHDCPFLAEKGHTAGQVEMIKGWQRIGTVCLSHVKGNFHAWFLGGVGAAMH